MPICHRHRFRRLTAPSPSSISPRAPVGSNVCARASSRRGVDPRMSEVLSERLPSEFVTRNRHASDASIAIFSSHAARSSCRAHLRAAARGTPRRRRPLSVNANERDLLEAARSTRRRPFRVCRPQVLRHLRLLPLESTGRSTAPRHDYYDGIPPSCDRRLSTRCSASRPGRPSRYPGYDATRHATVAFRVGCRPAPTTQHSRGRLPIIPTPTTLTRQPNVFWYGESRWRHIHSADLVPRSRRRQDAARGGRKPGGGGPHCRCSMLSACASDRGHRLGWTYSDHKPHRGDPAGGCGPVCVRARPSDCACYSSSRTSCARSTTRPWTLDAR